MTLCHRLELLRAVPVFKSLSDKELIGILDSPRTEEREYGTKALIVRESEPADSMYLVLDGAVEIQIRNVWGRDITVATLRAGDFFGEQALLSGEEGRRNASARAGHHARCLRIAREDVKLGVERDPEYAGEYSRTAGSEQERGNLLRGLRLFESLEESDFDNVREWTDVVEYQPGEIVLRRSEAGDSMYVVLEGSVDVYVLDPEGRINIIATLTRENYFGEQALLPHGEGTRNANVRASSKARLIRIPKEKFLEVLKRDPDLYAVLTMLSRSQNKRIHDLLS